MQQCNKIKSLIFILLLHFSLPVFAQTGLQILEAPVDIISCDSSCTMLHANFPHYLKTNQYQNYSIPFSPVNISGNLISVGDDKFSNAIPIGFNFCFFENSYSQCYVSDNGVLTFNAIYAGANCNNNTQQTLPYFNSTFPDNAIFFMFMDVDPTLGGVISYATLGTAPLRKLIIDFQGMQIFGSSCSNVVSDYQVILYESTNQIEVHAGNKTICDTNPLNYTNYATIGLQNQGVTSAFTAPGKHASIFTMSNEALRFEPSGLPDYLLLWKDASMNVLAVNTDSLYFCAPYLPYKISAQISYNCSGQFFTDTVRIKKILPKIDSLVIIKPLCTGNNAGKITVYSSGLNPPFLYALNTSVYTSANVFNNITPGNYTIHIKDAFGCIKDSAFVVNPVYNPMAFIDSVKHPVCPAHNGEIDIHVTGAVSPYTITWNNGATGTSLTGLAAGTFIAVIIDANGCACNAITTLHNDSVPVLQKIIVKPQCHNSGGSIQLITTGSVMPYQYQWSTGGTSSSINNLYEGYYSVTVTSANGCSVNETVAVVDTLDLHTMKYITHHTSCNLNNGQAYVYPSLGLPPYSFLWTPGFQTTATAMSLAAGTYICKTTDANNCIKYDTLTILPSPAIVNNISFADANCDSSNGKIYLNSVLNQTGSLSVLLNSIPSPASITGLNAGTYILQAIDGIGCIDTDTITLINDGKPYLGVVTYTSPLCYGDSTGSVTLSGSGGTAPYKYSLDGFQFTSVAQINNILAGLYTVYITDANTCPNDTVINFEQPAELIATYITDTIVCYGDADAQISVQASGGFTPYLYSFNNSPFSTDSFYNQIGKGIYLVQVKDSNNCTETFEVMVAGPDEALQLFTEKQDGLCFDTLSASVKVFIQGGWMPYTYTWSNGFTGLEQINLSESELDFELIDSLGCRLTEHISIKQEHCCVAAVPNAFSPNRDGKNDVLRVIPVSEVQWVKFAIYDRWGSNIFSTKDLYKGWDGTFRGKDCEIGTYFFYLEYGCLFQKEKVVLKGDITLLR